MNAKDFITRQLGTTGWAPIDHEIAKHLCPEMASQHYDFTSWNGTPAILLRLFSRTALYRVRVDGFGTVLVLARNGRFLDERMAWLGFSASEIVEVGVTVPYAVQAPKAPAPKFADERLTRLKALAEQEPPAHACSLRTDILAAKREIDAMTKQAPAVSSEPDNRAVTECAEEPSATDRALVIIADMLKSGPCDAAEILATAEGAGISERTMQVAAERMGVVKRKAGFSGGWTWAMPEIKAAA